MINDIEQETLDISWFFTNGEMVGFMASGGGKLPPSVAKSYENLNLLLSYFADLPSTHDIVINPDLGKIITNINDAYLSDFVNMARKGLFCYDRTVINNFSKSDYHLVAKPFNPLTINELPPEIAKILGATNYNGPMDSILDANLIT